MRMSGRRCCGNSTTEDPVSTAVRLAVQLQARSVAKRRAGIAIGIEGKVGVGKERVP